MFRDFYPKAIHHLPKNSQATPSQLERETRNYSGNTEENQTATKNPTQAVALVETKAAAQETREGIAVDY